jgi:hypothetical protein
VAELGHCASSFAAGGEVAAVLAVLRRSTDVYGHVALHIACVFVADAFWTLLFVREQLSCAWLRCVTGREHAVCRDNTAIMSASNSGAGFGCAL